LKPTEHRVSLRGFFRQPEGVPDTVRIMSCLGPIARSLDDIELVLRLISGPGTHSLELPAVPLAPSGDVALRGLRLAIVPTLPGVPMSQDARACIERVAARLSNAGAQVSERLPEVDWDTSSKWFIDLVTALTGLFAPDAQLRDEQRTLPWYLTALSARDREIARWQRFFGEIDALLLPAAMSAAFSHCPSGSEIEVESQSVSYVQHSRLGIFCNFAGLPSLAVPAGFTSDRLPLGLQIVGPLWSEMRLIDIARALEAAEILPGFTPPPAPGALAPGRSGG
jgi:amidase